MKKKIRTKDKDKKYRRKDKLKFLSTQKLQEKKIRTKNIYLFFDFRVC